MDPHICIFRRNKSISHTEIQYDKKEKRDMDYTLEMNYIHSLLHLTMLTEASWRRPGLWGFLNTQREDTE